MTESRSTAIHGSRGWFRFRQLVVMIPSSLQLNHSSSFTTTTTTLAGQSYHPAARCSPRLSFAFSPVAQQHAPLQICIHTRICSMSSIERSITTILRIYCNFARHSSSRSFKSNVLVAGTLVSPIAVLYLMTHRAKQAPHYLILAVSEDNHQAHAKGVLHPGDQPQTEEQ